MHKTLRIVYGMLKNKTLFDPEIDKVNTKKKNKTRTCRANELIKDRRYQKFDTAAPISGRQSRKRKEWAGSQNEISFSAGSPKPTPLNNLN